MGEIELRLPGPPFRRSPLSAMSRYVCGIVAVCALAGAAAGVLRAQQPPLEDLPMPAILKQYQPVSAERLRTPGDGDWPMFRRTYDGWGYSPLTQITPDNVKRLQPVWVFSTGAENGHEAPP